MKITTRIPEGTRSAAFALRLIEVLGDGEWHDIHDLALNLAPFFDLQTRSAENLIYQLKRDSVLIKSNRQVTLNSKQPQWHVYEI